MKRACLSLLLAVCTGAGCITLPSLKPDEKKPEVPPTPRITKPVRHLPGVTPDQVNEENVRDKADALQAELERDAGG